MNDFLDSNRLIQFCRENVKRMMKPAKGIFKYPFVDPGAGYTDNLWDWDSFWTGKAIIDLYVLSETEMGSNFKEELSRTLKGVVENFLSFQQEDGFIPMIVTAEGPYATFLVEEHLQGVKVNQHKPFLCQSAKNASKFSNDMDWLSNVYHGLVRYLEFYNANQFDERTGLYFWANDVMIGIDNNPSVFGRPHGSAADIYLNSFLFLEFKTMADICDMINQTMQKQFYLNKANELAMAINRHCYDSRDGFYYTADLLVDNRSAGHFQHGKGPQWHSLKTKVRCWSGFLPLLCGIPSAEQAAEMVQKQYLDPLFRCQYGIRTLAADEPMYSTESTTNPSNWLGPVWIISNYCLFKGLLNYGYIEEAVQICKSTITLLNNDIIQENCMSESYHPDSGAPMMHQGFLNWNYLAVSMLRELSPYEKHLF